VCHRLTGRTSEPQTCTTGICGMARCTGACPVSGWVTGFFRLRECEMDKTARERLIREIGQVWLKVHQASQDVDMMPEFRVQAGTAASHLVKAEIALHAPRGGGATSSTASSAESEVANG
jgi:hypothetical protein